MNARITWLPLLVTSACCVCAGEEPTLSSFSTSSSAPAVNWNTDPAYWDRLLEQRPQTGLHLGKSDFRVSGPLIEGLRVRRAGPNRSLGRKILDLPVVCWFVPQPMPSPPGGGKYFRWRNNERTWVSVAAGAAPGGSQEVRHEASSSLISISR